MNESSDILSSPSIPRRLAWFAVPVLAPVLGACFDFGYAIAEVAPDTATAETTTEGETQPGDGEPTCVEGPTTPSADGPQIKYTSMSADRLVVPITAGETVTWTNADSVAHTVTAGAPGAELSTAAGGFDSGDLAPGAQYAYRFCAPRTVFYFCRPHAEQMKNYRIIVQ